MLSVIIPVYNVEKYLDKCIESVVKQTNKELEIIIINDGSTDNSSKICEKWAKLDERIVYINKVNEGSGKTRNLGINIAKGEYITFLDSDDWWREDYVELMMSCMENCDIAVCDMNYIDCDKDGMENCHISKIRMPDRIGQSVSDDVDVINKARTFLCGKVFRKSLFVDNEIEQPTMAINDIPITTLLVAKSRHICRVGEPLYNYLRTREGNTITSVNAIKSFGDALVAMRENFVKHNLIEEYELALKKMYYSQYRFAMRKAIAQRKQGNISEKDFFDIQEYIENILYDFWGNCPDVKKIFFKKSEDEDINKALEFLVLDNDNISENKYDYVVECTGEKKDTFNEKMHILSVIKKEQLTGEDLWWDMADQLLFELQK